MKKLKSKMALDFIHAMLDILYRQDNFLLQKKLDITERAITHRMGMHLQALIPDMHVDCEYNRMGRKTDAGISYTDGDYFAKTVGLSDGSVPDDDDKGSRVFPDIIVHERGTNNNYIIIEVKVDWKSDKAGHDKKKLTAYKKDLNYQFAFYLQLTENRKDVKIEPV